MTGYMDIDWTRSNEEIIEQLKEYIRFLESTVVQLEETLQAECLYSQELYGQIIFLEEKLQETEKEDIINEREI